ncbi:hypothetical protein IEO21_01852 [Rhodonia placenta]|uniref:DUF3835 domain-containing protein n=1 Tax=Rhodonia placenta TaxID=104341 RepID=A0A8H7U5M6_9APHY|nr:hypothetical protein IEO21_01852 [Postia placenta]
MTPGQVKKISEKLGEILGDAADVGDQKRNEKGEVRLPTLQLVNEEGLPIVDIVEPVRETSTSYPPPADLFDDPDLLPPWALSDAEKARRRTERERILDMLEEEEDIEQDREEAAERERHRAQLETRKEAAKAELDALRKAKELQKKMGKALLRNVIEAKEREEKDAIARQREEEAERESKRNLKPKKSVTFVDPLMDDEAATPTTPKAEMGDVSLARLQRKGKSTLLTKTQMDKQPMKMQVVERHPIGLRDHLSALQPQDHDSDDESEPGSPVPADSDEGEVIYSDADDGEPVHWEEDEFDFARHQREVALAYYEKRATIGATAASAMRAHTHNEGENEWDQPATLASAPPKPASSRFKAARSTSTLASHSLGPAVLPSSQSSSLRSSLRMGKLEDDHLVGEESDDDEAEARAIVELLSKGEFTNIGPQSTAFPGHATSSIPTALPATESSETPVSQRKPSKASKFKLSLAQPQEPSKPGQPSSTLDTPVSTMERSSPKLTSPGPGTPIAVPTSSSRQPGRAPNASASLGPTGSPRTQPGQAQMPSMIVESPSFRPPGRAPPRVVTSSPLTKPSPMATDSPSYQSPPDSASTESSQNAQRTGAGGREKVSRFLAERM